MKLKTHYIFSLGVITLFLSALSRDFYTNIFIAAYFSFIGNSLIDRIGHKEMLTRKGYLPVRTPLTHTYPRSILWGLLPAIPLILLYGYHIDYHPNTLIYIIIAGIIVGPTHMFLDMFTEAGIYVKKDGRWKRFALAHYRYDDPFVNGLAIFAGFILLLMAYYMVYNYYF